MLMWLAVIITVPAAAFALALVSDMFAFSLSKAVEAAFEGVEYRMALRERERESRAESVRARPAEAVAFRASAARAA